jgi:beta-N-acetylglucosaminidase
MERNNLYSYGAADGATWKAVSFATVEVGISQVAKHIKEDYLTEGGAYFNGYSVQAMNKRYATDKEWSDKLMNMLKLK